MARHPSDFDNYPDSLAALAPFGAPVRAVIRHIVDGDTLDCLTDFGYGEYGYKTIRLLGVNCPEIFHPHDAAERAAGMAARDYVASIAPEGTPCVLRDSQKDQTFGRFVARVILTDGTDLGDALVAAGHAVVMEV